jgi:hypothetical protein
MVRDHFDTDQFGPQENNSPHLMTTQVTNPAIAEPEVPTSVYRTVLSHSHAPHVLAIDFPNISFNVTLPSPSGFIWLRTGTSGGFL